MDKKQISRLVAEYLALGGKVTVLPAGTADGAEGVATWASQRMAPVGKAA